MKKAKSHQKNRHPKSVGAMFWRWPRGVWRFVRRWIRRSFWHKLVAGFLVLIMFWVGGMYGIARWYIASHEHKPLIWGVTFIPGYAQSFGLDPKETMQAMIDDLGVKHFRLVSYWERSEALEGEYDFSELDWQFKKAEAAGASVSLSIGLRQPRWPECHMPTWVSTQTKDHWYPLLKNYMAAVINRYKTSPALVSYQLENEYFLKIFGACRDFSRERLVDEYNFVKQLDPEHTLIVSRSNNAIGMPMGEPTPDMYAVSVYKRVWDKAVTKRYFEYPFPAWFYGFLAGGGQILTGKDMIVHELQAEPWPPDIEIWNTSLSEQDKSVNPKRLADRLEYGKATGMRNIDLWGAEWWYWRKVRFNDPGLWNVVKNEIAQTKIKNQELTK